MKSEGVVSIRQAGVAARAEAAIGSVMSRFSAR
jgi:hypothetical protein